MGHVCSRLFPGWCNDTAVLAGLQVLHVGEWDALGLPGVPEPWGALPGHVPHACRAMAGHAGQALLWPAMLGAVSGEARDRQRQTDRQSD